MLKFKCWIEKVQYHRGAGAEKLYYVYCEEIGIRFFFTFWQVLQYIESCRKKRVLAYILKINKNRSINDCKVSLVFSKNGCR